MIYFEDLQVGAETEFGSYQVTREEVLEFARKYDPQPFHVDKEAATRSIYGGLIASGWHTAAVRMKLTIAHRRAQIAAGAPAVQDNFVSPGVREIKWHKPVRPGTTLRYTNESFAKLDWPSLPKFGLIEGMNEARDETGALYYSFINRVLIARRGM